MTPLPATTAPSPPIIRAESSADFLALLPTLTGYAVTESLLAVLFRGNRTVGALRFDLPPNDDPRAGAELATTAVNALNRMAKIDGVAFAIMTGLSSTDCGGVPWRHLARRLEHKIARTGLVLRDSCCVAANGWTSYLSPTPGGALRPLNEIAQSLAGFESALVTQQPILTIEELGALPETDQQRAASVRHAIDDLSARSRGSAFNGPRLTALVARPGAIATVNDAARIACAAMPLEGWLRLVCATMAACIDPSYPSGELGSDDVGPVSEAYYVADCLERGGAFDDPDELTRRFGPLAHALVMFAGLQPDREACRRAITLLSEVNAHVPPEQQVGLRCLLAWLWWWTGLASIAAQQVEAARELAPNNTLVSLLGHVVDSGTMAPWTFDSEIWRGTNA